MSSRSILFAVLIAASPAILAQAQRPAAAPPQSQRPAAQLPQAQPAAAQPVKDPGPVDAPGALQLKPAERAQQQASADAMFKRADTNGDGLLSPEEMISFRKGVLPPQGAADKGVGAKPVKAAPTATKN